MMQYFFFLFGHDFHFFSTEKLSAFIRVDLINHTYTVDDNHDDALQTTVTNDIQTAYSSFGVHSVSVIEFESANDGKTRCHFEVLLTSIFTAHNLNELNLTAIDEELYSNFHASVGSKY